jgi:hypothetical protein
MLLPARVLAAAFVFLFPSAAAAYSVLTHEAIVDTLWRDAMRPALLKRFPNSTEAQLKDAHAYAYGGCIIQDLGYYPFGNHFFSDLVHYVRSADFLQALVDESRDLNEYAFALGAVAHYGADVEGHSIAVNKAVPLLYPKLRAKFGPDVTYADDHKSHLQTEFGFDVLQVARGRYAPQAYHDFIGFEVSKDLLDRAFFDTYGIHLSDLFHFLKLTMGTYRWSVSRVVPSMTHFAWELKSKEIQKDQPGASRKAFLYNLSRASYEKEWGNSYQKPSFGTRILTFLLRIIPHFGPLKGIGFKVPTAQTEKMFEDSFDAAVDHDRRYFSEASSGKLRIANRDLDTGNTVRPGEYLLTDVTYDKLLRMLAAKKFEGVSPDLRSNIIAFYAHMPGPDRHGIGPQLDSLKAYANKAPGSRP